MRFALVALLLTLPLHAADARKALAVELFTLLDVKNQAIYAWPEGEVRNRMVAKLDPVTLAEEVYVPLILDRFSEKELRELIAFYKTRVGQKSAALMPHLFDPSALMASPYVMRIGREVSEELEREKDGSDPVNRARVCSTCASSRRA
ncbi:MAG TPA: DUF2059 domain-containing protein [Thermoanaerobaculia bacterium]|nr:DUF2059 domain-containing protein [Thermoanaerobaculia bacterium]